MRLFATRVVFCYMAQAGVARAEPGPPPDLSKGERSDGKVRDNPTYDGLLALPRILLAPPRLLLRALGEPVRAVLALDERYHVFNFLTHLVTSADGTRGLRPEIRYISRLAPQLAVTYFDRKLLGEGSSLSLTIGAVLPGLAFAEFGVRPHLPDRYALAITGTYLKRDDAFFAGVGLSSPGGLAANENPRARVAIESVDVGATLEVKLHKLLRLKGAESWIFRRYGNGRRDKVGSELPVAEAYCRGSVHGQCLVPAVDEARVPGFYDGANYFATDARLAFDTRTGTYSSRLWLRLELGGRYAQSPSLAGPSWLSGRGTIAAGVPLGGTRALVLRIAAEMMKPTSDCVVPFSELIALGGPDDLRGSPLGRYRDFSSVLATLEYRWAVWMWMDAAIFTDWGGVFGQRFQGFAIDRIVPNVGVGIQIHTAHHFVLRAQVAYGFGEGLQVLFATTTGL